MKRDPQPESVLRSLRLFVAKARELEQSRLASWMARSSAWFEISWNKKKGLTTSRTLPDQDAIKAFVLDLRFFIRDTDGVSLRSVVRLARQLGFWGPPGWARPRVRRLPRHIP